jgi:hypothetical protein
LKGTGRKKAKKLKIPCKNPIASGNDFNEKRKVTENNVNHQRDMPGGFDNPVHANTARFSQQNGNDSDQHHSALDRCVILPTIQTRKTQTLKA